MVDICPYIYLCIVVAVAVEIYKCFECF